MLPAIPCGRQMIKINISVSPLTAMGNGSRGRSPHHAQDRLSVDGAPTIHCFHSSCAVTIANANLRLRRELGAESWELALPGGCELRSGDVLQEGWQREGKGGDSQPRCPLLVRRTAFNRPKRAAKIAKGKFVVLVIAGVADSQPRGRTGLGRVTSPTGTTDDVGSLAEEQLKSRAAK